MVDTLIKNFTQISKTDTEIAGGKGASLGEMTQAGIPVPEGFVILSNAFERFIEETDLNVEISAILDTVDIKAVHTVENASENIQAMILSKEMPDDIKTDILKFYENLDCKFVAVRSSATSEDSASAAWAGQLESYLNTTKETLLENVKKCWASLFTPRAIFYRFEKKLNKDKISVAVVVQKMVDSEESGIAFSVHPVTQDENQIIIEAGFGLGEAIVSGSITPDSYVVDKQGFDILDINVNEQTKALYKKAKGGNEWKELGDRGKKQVLTVKEIYELSKLIVKIENHYGFPCDIEWAKSRGEYYITQSRPITTLVDAGKNKKTKWKFIVDRPLSVLAIAMLSTCYSSSYIKRYLDIDGLLDGNLFIPNRTFAPDGIIKQIKEYQVKKHKEEGNKYLWKMAELCESKGEALIAESQKLFSLNIGDLPNKNLAEELMGIVEQSRDYSPFIITIWFLESYLEEIVKSLKKKIPKDFHEYLEMPEKYNETQKEARAILELAVSDKATLKQKIRNYIDDYGWMQIKYFIGNLPSIKDIEKRISKVDSPQENLRKIVQNNKRNRNTKDKLNKILTDKDFDTVHLVKKYVYLRTYRTDVIAKSQAYMYLLFEEIAKRLHVSLDDLFYFTPEEMKEMLLEDNLKKDLISLRKEKWMLITQNSKLQMFSGTEEVKEEMERQQIPEEEKISTEKIKGKIAYEGNVKGKVKLVTDQRDLQKVKKGDILVAVMTFPSFIIAMEKAAAFVTDEGGLLCHAAIVSREMEKPCIIGTKIATRALKDGDMVEVDANHGIVRILKKKNK